MSRLSSPRGAGMLFISVFIPSASNFTPAYTHHSSIFVIVFLCWVSASLLLAIDLFDSPSLGPCTSSVKEKAPIYCSLVECDLSEELFKSTRKSNNFPDPA